MTTRSCPRRLRLLLRQLWLVTAAGLVACGCGADAQTSPATAGTADTAATGMTQHSSAPPSSTGRDSTERDSADPDKVPAVGRLDSAAASRLTSPAASPDPLAVAAPAATARIGADSAAEIPPTAAPAPGNMPDSVRLADDRPPLDLQRLEAAGIRCVRSRRLVLLSDLPPEQLAELPLLADQLYDALEEKLGALPPAADGSDFQVTGCLMSARERFQEAGLLPELDLVIRHGRHLNYRFWMFNPPADYYRRHLLLHEFTHCFMTCQHGMRDIPPLWYTEGIAEYFATHQLPQEPGGVAAFGVLPRVTGQFEGWGRISEIRRSFQAEPSAVPADAGFTTLNSVLYPADLRFEQDTQYAHAWALYWMLQTHPEYVPHFRALSRVRSAREFAAALSMVPADVLQRLSRDWLLLLDTVTEGFDVARSFPLRGGSTGLSTAAAAPPAAVPAGDPLSSSSQQLQLDVPADRDWQFTGVVLRGGQSLQLTAAGRFTVASDPQPWVAEPQGITIAWHRGRPLGELVAMLVAVDGSQATRRIPVGVSATLVAPVDAELWLQLNDSSASRHDNSGSARVTFTQVADDAPAAAPPGAPP